MLIVTAVDKNYIPGLIALYNSYKINARSSYQFICMVHDAETQIIVKDLNIPYIFVNWTTEVPITEEWPNQSAAMYSRLLIPTLFEDEHLLWIDADAIIINDLPPIPNLHNYACGSVITSTTKIGQQVKGKLPNYKLNLPAVQAGVLAFNRNNWIKDNILEKCYETMKLKNLDFIYVVQSVLSYVLDGKFKELDYTWNTFANRGTIPEDTLIAHFVGQKFLPWKNKQIPNIKIWEYYYNKGKVL